MRIGLLACSLSLALVAFACSSTTPPGATEIDGGSSSTSSTGGPGADAGGSAATTGGTGSGSSTSGDGTSNSSGGANGGSSSNSSSGANGGSTSSSSGASGSTMSSSSGGDDASASSSSGSSNVAPFYTDDFESDTSGSQPSGWNNLIAYNYNTANPQGDGTGALADNTHTHNSSKLAVHFKASGNNPVFLERALPSGITHLYVRVYFFLANELGMQPSTRGDNHETLIGITADPTNVNTQVRFGQIKGVIGTNQVPSDNIAPVMAEWNSGPVISAGTWHCIQVEFAGDATYNSLYAYSDGTLVHSITKASDWQNGPLAADWMHGMFMDVMFGWQSFSGMPNDIWMDDLVMSTGPVSCN